jgi:hypothetical protein
MSYRLTAAACIIVCLPGAAWAQQKIQSSWVNDSGYRVTNFSAKPSGSGCTGGQDYVKVSDPTVKGYSRMRWDSATKQDGGVLCSGGTWFYGDGPQKGQAGGSTSNVLVKGGSYYRMP